jgi:protein-disulfide isomerase
MAAKPPGSDKRPSGRTVVLAFGIAVAAAAALVVVALVARTDSSVPATETPVVDLSGIPQEGAVLGAPEATVTLVEWADPQCPACRTYTEEFFPVVRLLAARSNINLTVEPRGPRILSRTSRDVLPVIFTPSTSTIRSP